MNGWRWLKGYLRAYSGASITKKAIAIYIVVVLVPGCLLFLLYFQQTSGIIEREMSDSMLQTLNQAEYNISNGLDNVASVSDSVIANQGIAQYLSGSAKPAYEQFEDFQELEKLLVSLERNRGIHRIRLFVDPRLTYSREDIHFFSLQDLDREAAWYRNMIARNGGNYWRGTYLQPYLGESDAKVISAVRMLHDPLHYESVIGVLSIDVKVNMIQEILSRVSLSSSQEVFVVDDDRRLVSHQDAARLGQPADLTAAQMEQLEKSKEGSFRDDQGTTSFLYRRIPNTDWSIVAKLPTAELSGKSVVLTKVSAVLLLGIGSIVFIFFLVLAFAAAAESLAKRVRDMNRTLKAEGSAHFDGSLPKPKGDLRQLESAISRMVQTVHDLTAESYRSKLHERDAQLKALQAQVDPHFLYNTLDSMNWMAIRRGADEISDLIEALSTYFRLSLNKGSDVVTLAEELQLIRSYMHIHNTRDDSGIELFCEVEETLLSCRLPKLTLQPIVENAVLHGIHMKRPKRGTIDISAKLEGPWLTIEIRDDGVGMASERLALLLEPPSPDNKVESYGLYNVHERLRLFSRDNGAGVTMTSRPGSGTNVLLKIKIPSN